MAAGVPETVSRAVAKGRPVELDWGSFCALYSPSWAPC